MYTVIFKNIAEDLSKGVLTYSSFKDQQHFEKWYTTRMRGWYEVIEQGVSKERAAEICSYTTRAAQFIEMLRRF